MRRTLALAAVAVLGALSLPATASAQAGGGASVYVIHGVPGLVADVWVSGDRVLEQFEFGTVTDALSLPAGTYQIEIFPTGSDPATDDPVLESTATVADGQNVSVVAHLDAAGAPVLSVFDNDVAPVTPGTARAIFRHTAAAPAIDVRAAGTPAVVALTNGGESIVQPVPATTVPIDIVMSGTDDVVFGPADVNFESGSVVVAYAVGSPDDDSFDVLVQVLPAQEAQAEQPPGTAAPTGDDATAPADGTEGMPTAVPAGSGGLADAGGLPVVAVVVVAAALVVLAASGALLVWKRN